MDTDNDQLKKTSSDWAGPSLEQGKYNSQNPNLTVGLYCLHENDVTTTTTHPPLQTQCQQYLSCYWSDFDQNLKVGSLEHLEQIMETLAQA